ncbi:MAG: tRNA pseudouridine(38-40) synthase TruA [Candidatus Kapaibacterium sp.]|nr:MAG: tRNA pseudouridine(38-40) synthase TruA [Candidatus Kapabacteria bacterium]
MKYASHHASATETKRLALLIEYDGTRYAGWQRQPQIASIQGVLEDVCQATFWEASNDGSPSPIFTINGSGRTDAGVHGRGQVAHVDIPIENRIAEEKIARALNARLPMDIRIRAAKIVDVGICTRERFHARFGARRREYRYNLLEEYTVFRTRYAWHVRQTLQTAFLQEAADIFCGKHNFTSFSKHNPATENYVCTVQESAWNEVERGTWQYTIVADRFVYGMVRAIVGASIDAALGKRSIGELRVALGAENRELSSPLAPPEGLILWSVRYEEGRDPFAEYYENEAAMSVLG